MPEDGYEYAHAMALSALLGKGDKDLISEVESGGFKPSDILYIGVQELHNYQEKFLDEMGVSRGIGRENSFESEKIETFFSKI